jgi:hypothetical protein
MNSLTNSMAKLAVNPKAQAKKQPARRIRNRNQSPATKIEIALPFPGAEGKWVVREQFPSADRKSFGYYVCPCRKKWTSAHAQVEFKQSCKRCETWSFPNFMWVNSNTTRRSDKDDLNRTKPHDHQRCEACATGRCTSV